MNKIEDEANFPFGN